METIKVLGMTVQQISRTVRVFSVAHRGETIGTINAHREGKIHAISPDSIVHYGPSIEDCAAWLQRRVQRPCGVCGEDLTGQQSHRCR